VSSQSFKRGDSSSALTRTTEQRQTNAKTTKISYSLAPEPHESEHDSFISKLREKKGLQQIVGTSRAFRAVLESIP
jgi:hypothetical protein